MFLIYFIILGDPCQVHHLIPLHQKLIILMKLLFLAFCQPDIQLA